MKPEGLEDFISKVWDGELNSIIKTLKIRFFIK